MSTPTLLESIQHVFIKKVAVNSGGKHCLALSSEGEVYSWGEAEDGKLGHGNRRYEHTASVPRLPRLSVSVLCGLLARSSSGQLLSRVRRYRRAWQEYAHAACVARPTDASTRGQIHLASCHPLPQIPVPWSELPAEPQLALCVCDTNKTVGAGRRARGGEGTHRWQSC